MNLADFIIRIGLNSTNFTTGANKAVNDLERIDSTFKRIAGAKSAFLGAVAGSAIGSFLLSSFNKAEQKLDELLEKAKNIKIGSTRTGMDTTTFQQASNVFESKGSSPDKMETSLEKTADAIQAIRDGADDGAKLQTAFARLGITLDDIKKKRHQDVWREIFENMHAAEMTTERIAALKDIFGKGAGELIPVMKEGLTGKAANHGVILDPTQLEGLSALSKELKEASVPVIEGAANLALKLRTGFATLMTGRQLLTDLLTGTNPMHGAEGAPQGPNEKAMEQRLLEVRTAKAEKEAAEAAKKKRKDDVKKRAEEIAKEYSKQLEIAAKNQLDAASPSQRRQLLRERNQALDSQISNIDSDIRLNGDETGEKALRRLQLVNQRNEQRNQIAGINVKGISLLPEGASERTRIGLFTGRNSDNEHNFQTLLNHQQTQISELRQIVNEVRGMRQDINE